MWSVLPFVQMCSCAAAGVWHPQLPKKLQIQALCKFPQSYSEGSVPAAEMLHYGFIFSWETKAKCDPTDWQIAMVCQERLFSGSCSIMDKHLECVQPKH